MHINVTCPVHVTCLYPYLSVLLDVYTHVYTRTCLDTCLSLYLSKVLHYLGPRGMRLLHEYFYTWRLHGIHTTSLLHNH